MARKKTTKEYLQGVPELLILRLLEMREMYGYEIVQGIKLRTHGTVEFREGVIYPLLHSLQKRRFLTIRRESVNGRPRVYYRLTSSGRKKLATKVLEWNRVTEAIRNVLEGGSGEAAIT